MESMERLKGKRVVVTGGAGFIGSHLVEKLVKLGSKVFVIDNKFQKNSYFIVSNLNDLSTCINLDIRNKERVDKTFQKIRPDYVYHLAAEPIVEDCYEHPYKAYETNIMGTVHILEALRSMKYAKGIIVASSDKAYGKTKKAYTENSPLKGDHPYDVSKSSADLISQSYYTTYGMPIVITRFGNVYGGGDLHFDRLIPGICKAVIEKKPLKVRSDGTYVRDYLYVKDVADGCILLLRKIKGIYGQAYNLSSKDNFSVTEVVKRSERILSTSIPYEILNTAINEIPYQKLNDSKIRRLGWRTKYTLNSALEPTLAWYKKIL